ncbi:spherulation-specific family 4 protein [Streptosporangium sp. NPDC000239]|uniref:spherulation-specific family 4 protein n=1 Tax=Streptosporangium sp. NPDC000239 TaxID=3154248 RepID=UPI0033217D62
MTRRGMAAVTAAVASLIAFTPAPAQADAILGQEVAVPAYFYPGGSSAQYWTQLTASGSRPSIAVVNVLNGPTGTVNTDYQAALASAHSAGIKVIGYVDTGYYGTTGQTTRMGSASINDWRTQIQTDVDNWYNLYGSNVDGIFFDQAQKDCGPTGGGDAWVDLYREASAYVKKYHPGSITIHNPGTAPDECYEDSADILVTFEGTYATYMNPPADQAPPAWQAGYDPKRVWNLVYDVKDESELATVMAKSKANNAGYVYVTPDKLDEFGNPWDTLPPSSYMSAELAATAGSGGSTPSAPAAPTTSQVEATSLQLSWASAAHPGVVGYDVYQGSVKIGTQANHTPSATTFDVAGLSPSTAYTFSVRARDRAGNTSAASTAVSVTTAAASATAPTTPGTPVASDVAPTSVKLAWTASDDTDADDHVASYDVFRDGVRVLSVPGDVTTVNLGGLKGGQTYAFTVKARDTTDRPSAASGAVSVSTPNPPAITDPKATLSATTATYTAQFNVPFNFHHVFIDVDNNVANHYTVAGVGAEYMIEDGGLYKYVGPDWNWTKVTGVNPLISSSGGLYRWSIPTSALEGAGTTHSLVFNGTGDSPNTYTGVITVTQS